MFLSPAEGGGGWVASVRRVPSCILINVLYSFLLLHLGCILVTGDNKIDTPSFHCDLKNYSQHGRKHMTYLSSQTQPGSIVTAIELVTLALLLTVGNGK